ncbi:MAG: hypothetical protein ACE5KE_00050 [Methanosarcinales archaeon]
MTKKGDSEIFTYNGFKDLINYIKDFAPITSFNKWNKKRGVILRHDVDLSLRAAYRLFAIERDLQITSTFCILTTCATYNIVSSENRKILKDISSNGFEIALHFDPQVYETTDIEILQNQAKKECEIIEYIIGEKVSTISLHNPSFLKDLPLFDGFLNAYDKKCFSNENYISDSMRSFKGKNPYEFVKKAKTQTIQMILHPEHFSEHYISYLDIFKNHIISEVNFLDKYFKKYNSKFREEIGSSSLREKLRFIG